MSQNEVSKQNAPYPVEGNDTLEVASPKVKSDRELLEAVLALCLAYKVVFPYATQEQQVEFLQSGYQAIMESLQDLHPNAQVFTEVTSAALSILDGARE